MKNFIPIPVLFLLAALLCSCDKDDDKYTIIVGPQIYEHDWGRSFYIKKNQKDEWTREEIYDFDSYEEGYEYVIKVKKESTKNPPQDSGSSWYVYIRTISKEKAEYTIH